MNPCDCVGVERGAGPRQGGSSLSFSALSHHPPPPEGAALDKESEREDGLGNTHGHHPVGIVPLVLAPGLGELPDLAHLAVGEEVGGKAKRSCGWGQRLRKRSE